MVFSSIVCLSVFIPITFVLHLIVPSLRVKNIILLIASLLFYAYGEPVYVLLLIASALVNYVGARCVKGRTWLLSLIVVLNVGLLVVFKYTGFLLQIFMSLTGMSFHVPQITMPIGISFFTFQAMSYVIDTYRGEVQPQKNFLRVLLYISFFPQLIAGPIVRYKDIEAEIMDRQVTLIGVSSGLQRFILGLGKKVIIANAMGKVADTLFAASPAYLSAGAAWFGAAVYAFQLYYDFSGYSDMAIGLGRMFGFHFKENFEFPYGAANMQTFWRRWHISLSTWFKNYVYIPLGGNRKGRARTSINRLIVFFLTGLWHGASWNFILWGLFHGLFLMLENVIPALQRLPKVIGHIYTWLVVCLSMVLFRADDLPAAGVYFRQMFTGFGYGGAGYSLLIQQLSPYFIFVLIIAIVCMAPIKPLIIKARQLASLEILVGKEKVWYIITMILSLVLLVLCMLRLAGDVYNPFIYFRF